MPQSAKPCYYEALSLPSFPTPRKFLALSNFLAFTEIIKESAINLTGRGRRGNSAL